MLHAVEHNKTKMHRRYLGERDENEKMVKGEDEIVSTIFGALDFLPPQDIFKFWQEALSNKLPCDLADKNAAIAFWQKNNGIEPDIVVTIGEWTLLIECKWSSGLSGEDQLSRQWLEFLNQEERKNAFHILIAHEAQKIVETQEKTVWGDRLIALSWRDIKSVFYKLSGDKTPLERWAKLSDRFLKDIGVYHFTGFSQFSGYKTDAIAARFFNQEGKQMSESQTDAGKAIFQIVSRVSEIGSQIEALLAKLDDELRSSLKDCGYKIDNSFASGFKDESTWVYVNAFYNIPITSKKSGVTRYLGFQVSLIGDGALASDEEPALHVFYWSVQCDKENYIVAGESDDEIIAKRLYRYLWDKDSWSYTVRLAKIDSPEDLDKYIVKPSIELLKASEEGKLDDQTVKEILPDEFFSDGFLVELPFWEKPKSK
ncbi:MAG: hypothetical protein LBQ52_00180 [Helicobacteraceae bacterium]|jgi:hypothetical protein|nr:hypothetical protein [Helicobacteraceae bacterium]